MKIFFACWLLVISASMSTLAQGDSLKMHVGYIDQTDLMTLIRGKKKTALETGIPKEGKWIMFAAPIFGSNPSLGTFYGLGGTGAIFFGPPETTSISNLNASLLLTTKNQFIATIKGTVMTANNKWEMLIDIKYSDFSESTYGLGSDFNQPIQESWDIGGIQTAGLEGAQPMAFNQFKLYYTLLREIKDNFYLGLGYHFDSHNNIQDMSLDLEAQEPVITSHYAYSTKFGYDPTGYISSGISLNGVFDSRDHTVNAYSGSFLHVSYRANPPALGNPRNYQQLYLEARVFKSLSERFPRHLIGFWAIGQFTTVGEVPYLHLPASSYDMRYRIGRGYVMGRFRGHSWVTAETEYRFPITKNGLLGGVLFGSITTTSRDELTIGTETVDKLRLFEANRPAAGFGARIMLNRTGRLNLGMDMAWGQNGSKGFYLVVGETF